MEVTVIVPTYNNAPYVEQCIDSILSQKTSFPFEILVGDDCSSDQTSLILQKYSKKYPQIKVIYRKENVGATQNIYDLCTKMQGRYYAYLEGDDYWCDNHKLQTQYDFLEKNSKYVGCFHDVQLVDAKGSIIDKKLSWVTRRKTMSLRSYDGYHLPGHPSTWMRRNLYLTSPSDFSPICDIDRNIGDRVAALCFLLKGDFYNVGGKRSCYRYIRNEQANNTTSKLYVSGNHALQDIDMLEKMEQCIKDFSSFKKNFISQKHQICGNSLIKYLRNPSLHNKKIFKEVYKKCSHHFLFFFKLPLLVIKKFYLKYSLNRVS